MMNAAVARVLALTASFNCDPRRFSGFTKFLSHCFHSLELEVIEIVLDQRTDLLAPHASSKANLYLLLIEGFEVGE